MESESSLEALRAVLQPLCRNNHVTWPLEVMTGTLSIMNKAMGTHRVQLTFALQHHHHPLQQHHPQPLLQLQQLLLQLLAPVLGVSQPVWHKHSRQALQTNAVMLAV